VLNKVFLVEDEIVTREGIRDNVDWASAGFEFCGEAPDGEVALPLIETTQPNVIITDIKMPFMDGLQLCKIVRERMPGTKVIILSGHDEFEYAQEAVKLGVTEYLLKPVGVQTLQKSLQKIAAQIEQDRQEQENFQKLRDQVDENRTLLRERFLLRLVMGAVPLTEAMEKSRLLDLDIIAKSYLVVVLRIELDHDEFDYFAYRQVREIATGLVENNPDVFLFKKDMEELVLIIKGDTPEYLEQEAYFLTELIKNELAGKTTCTLKMGIGQPQTRVGDIHQSFSRALAAIEGDVNGNGRSEQIATKTELLKLNKLAVADYLRCGAIEEFDDFFTTYIHPLGEAALNSYIIKNYVFVDIVLTTAKFVRELGGSIDQVVPEINQIETLLLNIKTVEQFKEQTRKILVSTLEFRDQHGNQYVEIIHQAKAYVEQHYSNPDLSLNEVAAHINLSSSHFSTVFSRETGETFKEYLTALKIQKAKELLRSTALKSFEISYQVGYKDPHYFSHVFKKQTGLSPKEFRLQGQME